MSIQRMVEGGRREAIPCGEPPPPLRGPPPRAGEKFATVATRLAGFAGAALGWSPDTFWRATPAELAAVVAVLNGGDETVAPPDRATLKKLQEAFPDG